MNSDTALDTDVSFDDLRVGGIGGLVDKFGGCSGGNDKVLVQHRDECSTFGDEAGRKDEVRCMV